MNKQISFRFAGFVLNIQLRKDNAQSRKTDLPKVDMVKRDAELKNLESEIDLGSIKARALQFRATHS